MTAETPVLRVTDLEVRYHGGSEPAVSGLSLSIDTGRSACLDGGEGAGKSSVVRAVLGLTPHTGEVAIAGERPSGALRRRMSYGPQAPDFAGGLTSRQVVGMVAGLRGLDASRTAAECLRLAALPEERWDLPVGSDSATSRRLSLALAAAGDPLVAVLDDPPNDPATEVVVRHVRGRGAAVLVAVADPWPELLAALDGPVIRLVEGRPE